MSKRTPGGYNMPEDDDANERLVALAPRMEAALRMLARQLPEASAFWQGFESATIKLTCDEVTELRAVLAEIDKEGG